MICKYQAKWKGASTNHVGVAEDRLQWNNLSWLGVVRLVRLSVGLPGDAAGDRPHRLPQNISTGTGCSRKNVLFNNLLPPLLVISCFLGPFAFDKLVANL